MILDILSLVLLLSALFSAWVTYRIVHDHLSTRSQRVAQTILVWLLPALGAMIVLHMQRQNPEPSSGKYREPPDPGDDFGMSGRSVRNSKDVVESSSPYSGGADSD